MNVLAVIHEAPPCSGVFADAAAERGDTIEEWSFASGQPPSLPIEEYGAVWLFGGVMHTHEEDDYPWLRDENAFILDLLERNVPLLGVCLGGQLIAKALGASVSVAPVPEIGFHEIELSPAAADDLLFETLPQGRLLALQWHYYRFDVPDEAIVLARNAVCPQAYRVGENAWGIQFHAETTHSDWLRWVDEWDAIDGADRAGFEPEFLREQATEHMATWNALGRAFAGRFLDLARAAP
jgi:GMP synthase-like glutamine amidotransferase